MTDTVPGRAHRRRASRSVASGPTAGAPAGGPTSTRCARRPAHVLTRDAPDDHPWHHGLWFTIKFVDEDNFWEEMAPYGVLRHDGPPEVEVRRRGVGPA